MIRAEQLLKTYGHTKAVNYISFEVAEQENLILLGTSGCGKTTTLKMLNRLIEPDSGSVIINGQNIAHQPPEQLRRSIGYVMQNNGLFPHYTVAENIAIVPKLLKWTEDHIQTRTHELLEKLHLPHEYLHLYPNQLSGGQQQRVGLARALMADAPVLLMDEPFGALDTITRTKIQQEFKELDELKRKTIVMVTHDVQEAFELADRICLMDQGCIVQTGTPAELLYQPASQFVNDFLKAQCLQLEFKVVRLTDVWAQLPEAKPDGAINIPSYYNIWTALEYLKESRQDVIYISNEQQIRSATFDQLMAAFHHYQIRH
jgi:osmoprotectant transport system ATP-binding protein